MIAAHRALLALAALGFVGPAAAETTACTEIASLPYTISAPGRYCLKRDLNTSLATGAAITVNTSNVIIDCNEHKLVGTAATGTTTTSGIYSSNQSNITVRQCGIRGFYRGTLLMGTGGSHLIENNKIDRNTHTGIRADGNAVVVRGNTVYNTGGTNAGGFAGIFVYGANGSVIDNDVGNVFGNQTSSVSVHGILVSGSGERETLARNRVTGLVPGPNQIAFGIVSSSPRTVFKGNTISSYGTKGRPIYAPNTNSICRDNELLGFDYAWISTRNGNAMFGCLNLAGNVVKFSGVP